MRAIAVATSAARPSCNVVWDISGNIEAAPVRAQGLVQGLTLGLTLKLGECRSIIESLVQGLTEVSFDPYGALRHS
jgi:hypothetical protein